MSRKNNKKYFSFDVFDTCVVRSCGCPDNVFTLLARSVVREKNESVIRAFVIERKQAEREARLQTGKDAVSLTEIYSNFALEFFSSWDRKVVMEREMEIERRSFVPVKRVKNLIEKARLEGEVFFISDMYLPQEFLTKALIELGLMKDDERLYVSGDVGLSKSSGKLFDYVKEHHNIDGYWLHQGDNYIGDYIMPKRKGIKARRILLNYTKLEASWESESDFSVSPLAVSIFSGVFRSLRLSNYDTNEEGHFVSNLMIPLFLTFVASIMKDARTKNIKRLYFASRDTYIMYLMARCLSSEFSEIEARYLYISTKTLYPTYIRDGEEDELRYILKIINDFVPIKVMKMLGFSREEIEKEGKVLDLNKTIHYSDNNSSVLTFIEKMLHGSNKQLLKERCETKRNNIKQYFEQEQFITGGDENVGLVDVGWRCTSQQMISKIVPNEVTYYYFGVSDNRLSIRQTGRFVSFTSWQSAPKLIEHYMCRTPFGSVWDYKMENLCVVPECAAGEAEADVEDINNNFQLAHTAACMFKANPVLLDYAEVLFFQYSYKAIKDYMKYPDRYDLRKFHRTLKVEILDEHFPVIKSLWPWDMLNYLCQIIFKTEKSKGYWAVWLEGSLVYTYGKIGRWMIKTRDKVLKSDSIRSKVKYLVYSSGMSKNRILTKFI